MVVVIVKRNNENIVIKYQDNFIDIHHQSNHY
jgi:hypothetical protein